MKRWQKAAILLVVTPILALAARFAMAAVFTWHFFFVAKCDGLSCQDNGTGLYATVFLIVGIAFTVYFFFAFVWLFNAQSGSRDASRG